MSDKPKYQLENHEYDLDLDQLTNRKPPKGTTIGDLVDYLFSCFPLNDCEPWDKSGLLVGSREAEVSGIAIALDPNVKTIEHASKLGCNVLLTHHPTYLNPPERFTEIECGGSDSANRVTAAIKNDVALIAMHTNLDRSPITGQVLANTLGMVYESGFVKEDPRKPAFGCVAKSKDSPKTLDQIASLCEDSYGIVPRVWGDPNLLVDTVGFCNGSSSSFASDIVLSGVNCIVTGEISYHKACEVCAAGKGLIELGHDVSEFPLLKCLAAVLHATDEFGQKISMVEPDVFWWQPGVMRR